MKKNHWDFLVNWISIIFYHFQHSTVYSSHFYPDVRCLTHTKHLYLSHWTHNHMWIASINPFPPRCAFGARFCFTSTYLLGNWSDWDDSSLKSVCWCVGNAFPYLNHVNWAIIGGDIALLSINMLGMFVGSCVSSNYFPKYVYRTPLSSTLCKLALYRWDIPMMRFCTFFPFCWFELHGNMFAITHPIFTSR